MSPWLASRLGYDPDRVAELPARHRRALALVALASMPAVGILGLGAGYGAFLASDVVGLSVAVGVGAGLYLLNLLRISVAGGGVGPQQPLAVVTTWMPRTVPLVMLGFLGGFFAQPLILAVLAAEQDPQVEQLRGALSAMHAEAVTRTIAEERTRAEVALKGVQTRFEARQRTLEARTRELAALRQPGGRQTLERAIADDRLELAAQRSEVERAGAALQQLREREGLVQVRDVEPYRRHLARSHFLLRRIELTWQRPLRPAVLSLVMVLLMVLPWIASATLARRASRAYEAGRWKANRALITAAHLEARRLEAQALIEWPTFEGPRLELHEDAPYNTRPRAGAGAFEARHG